MAGKANQNPRNFAQLVEHQTKKWDLEGGGAQRRQNRVEYWPVIAISRECGSLGGEVARIVAERLGFTHWDREIVDAIAEKSGANEPLLRSVDERERNAIDDFVRGLVLGGKYTSSTYVEELVRMMHIIAHHGRAVIVGRGAHYALSPNVVLRIRVVAPRHLRIAAVEERYNVDKKHAAALADRFDKDRAHFVDDTFRKDITQSSDYDLSINTGVFGVEGAADLVLTAYRQKFTRLPQDMRPTLQEFTEEAMQSPAAH